MQAALLLGMPLGGSRGQEAQIETARQAAATGALPAAPALSGTGALPAAAPTYEDDSFGEQQFLKRVERSKYFRAFAEISAFCTSNVALTRKKPISDAFLVASFGLEYRRAVRPGLEFDCSLRSATYRYGTVRELDFTSVDAGAGLTYHAPWLWSAELFARYNFTDLVSASSGREFFQNHTIALGAQRTFSFGRAHYAFAGVSAQFGFADPAANERNEYSIFAGYHVQLTRHWQADLFYKYGLFEYSVAGREDRNQLISLSGRYEVTEWLNVTGSAYFISNRSNRETFDYSSGNVGGGFGLMLRF